MFQFRYLNSNKPACTPAGNRTRVTTLEGSHSTTELQVLGWVGLQGVGFEPTRIPPGVLKTPALTKLCYPCVCPHMIVFYMRKYIYIYEPKTDGFPTTCIAR